MGFRGGRGGVLPSTDAALRARALALSVRSKGIGGRRLSSEPLRATNGLVLGFGGTAGGPFGGGGGGAETELPVGKGRSEFAIWENGFTSGDEGLDVVLDE